MSKMSTEVDCSGYSITAVVEIVSEMSTKVDM